jgi:hypothetical protein
MTNRAIRKGVMKFRAEIECMNNQDIPGGKLIIESSGIAGENGSNFVYLTIGEVTMEFRSIEVIEAITRLTGSLKL